MPGPDKNAFPVFAIAAFVGLAVVLMLWALVQTYEPTRASQTTGLTTGNVSNQPAVPTPPEPRNDTAWDSYRGTEAPPGKSR